MSHPAARRKNHVQAGHVDAALRVNRLLGKERAEALLLREGVNPKVIARVLADGSNIRRRK